MGVAYTLLEHQLCIRWDQGSIPRGYSKFLFMGRPLGVKGPARLHPRWVGRYQLAKKVVSTGFPAVG